MDFTARMAALGLRLPPEEAVKLEIMVAEIDESTAALRAERPYAQESLAGFRLDPAYPGKARG